MRRIISNSAIPVRKGRKPAVLHFFFSCINISTNQFPSSFILLLVFFHIASHGTHESNACLHASTNTTYYSLQPTVLFNTSERDREEREIYTERRKKAHHIDTPFLHKQCYQPTTQQRRTTALLPRFPGIPDFPATMDFETRYLLLQNCILNMFE